MIELKKEAEEKEVEESEQIRKYEILINNDEKLKQNDDESSKDKFQK